MEGGAFLYACLSENIPCIQIRSISNYVAPRNSAEWDIKKAVQTLNKTLLDYIYE
jgi:futalosine hydrolase